MIYAYIVRIKLSFLYDGELLDTRLFELEHPISIDFFEELTPKLNTYYNNKYEMFDEFVIMGVNFLHKLSKGEYSQKKRLESRIINYD